ncbi:MAG: hypothetical protein LBB23_02480 [Rickettsiales bacterium]|jgi:hypothetical protein|nr:hypothetical protein [Rickettsiales bacterium]
MNIKPVLLPFVALIIALSASQTFATETNECPNGRLPVELSKITPQPKSDDKTPPKSDHDEYWYYIEKNQDKNIKSMQDRLNIVRTYCEDKLILRQATVPGLAKPCYVTCPSNDKKTNNSSLKNSTISSGVVASDKPAKNQSPWWTLAPPPTPAPTPAPVAPVASAPAAAPAPAPTPAPAPAAVAVAPPVAPPASLSIKKKNPQPAATPPTEPWPTIYDDNWADLQGADSTTYRPINIPKTANTIQIGYDKFPCKVITGQQLSLRESQEKLCDADGAELNKEKILYIYTGLFAFNSTKRKTYYIVGNPSYDDCELASIIAGQKPIKTWMKRTEECFSGYPPSSDENPEKIFCYNNRRKRSDAANETERASWIKCEKSIKLAKITQSSEQTDTYIVEPDPAEPAPPPAPPAHPQPFNEADCVDKLYNNLALDKKYGELACKNQDVQAQIQRITDKSTPEEKDAIWEIIKNDNTLKTKQCVDKFAQVNIFADQTSEDCKRGEVQQAVKQAKIIGNQFDQKDDAIISALIQKNPQTAAALPPPLPDEDANNSTAENSPPVEGSPQAGVGQEFDTGKEPESETPTLADLSAFQLDGASWLTKTDGTLNTKRLLFDAGAGVALGAIGGFLTNHLVKSGQIDKGFEDIQCSVAGRPIMNFDDRVRISSTK